MAHQLPPLKVRVAVLVTIITLSTAGYYLSKVNWDKNRIRASGTIEVREADLAPRISARVLKVLVNEGQKVTKGQPLIELDDRVALAQKKAAQSAMSNAERTLERSRQLLAASSISKQQFEQAEAGYYAAASIFRQAEAAFEDAHMAAPWDGVILERHAEEGELVTPNAPLFTIGDMSTVKVRIYVPLREFGLLKPGMEAAVTADSYDKKFAGRIVRLSERAEFTPKNVQTKDERVKQVFSVDIEVPNPDYELKPGVPCDVVISLKEAN